MPAGSKIFLPNRALGYVSSQVPLQVRYIKSRKEYLVTTCVGKSFHTYNCEHFALLSVSDLHPTDILCMAGDTYHIYTASGTCIYAWRRGTEIKHVYRGHQKDVRFLLPFGAHLISVDESNVVKIWDIKSEEVYLELTFSNETMEISAIIHPSTYINKILLGSEQGELQLWNIKQGKLVYTFKSFGSGVSCLEQAPALDVVGIGLKSGKIVLHNLKYDETVLELFQDYGLVTALSFRTDGPPMMVSGTTVGHIVVWDLEQRRVSIQIACAHEASVTGLQFLPHEPLLVTSSADNTLKMWIFDQIDGGGRLLRQREGHSAPPTFVRFYGPDSGNVLSAGSDSSLRIFNTRNERYNKSLGKASFNRNITKKKSRIDADADALIMPPILEFSTSTTREKDWDNLVAAHLGLPMVTTWSCGKLKMGEHKLLPPRLKGQKKRLVSAPSAATSVFLTKCGNFVVVGYSTGHVERFNIQSGTYRGFYGQKETGKAHDGPVRGVVVDQLNKVLASCAGSTVNFWHFKLVGQPAFSSISLSESLSFFRHHQEGSLVACILDDFTACLLDLESRRRVRRFHGHTGQITDACFSPDSRWLLTASMDCTVKTWDIPTGQLVDHFRLASACTSLSLSATGDLLVTAHVDFPGLYLWANKTLYVSVTLKALPEEAVAPCVELPDCSVWLESEGEPEEDSSDLEDHQETASLQQLDPGLLTLSGLAASRWQNLLNLDIIKRRNKPKQPPKKPKAAPFFLPTVPSLSGLTFDLGAPKEGQEKGSRLLAPVSLTQLTAFGELVRTAGEKGEFQGVVDRLKDMGPSAIDVEVASMAPEDGGSVAVMSSFLRCIEFMLQSNKDFELAQSYLALFLRMHGAAIARNAELLQLLRRLQTEQNAGWNRLQDKLFYNLSVVQLLKCK